MKILSLFFFLAVVRFSHSQGRDDIIFDSLRVIHNNLTTLLDKFNEYEEIQKEQQTKISEIEMKQEEILSRYEETQRGNRIQISEIQEKQDNIMEKLEDVLGKLDQAESSTTGLVEEAETCLKIDQFEVFKTESLKGQKQIRQEIIEGVVFQSNSEYKSVCPYGFTLKGSKCEEIPCEGPHTKMIKDLGCVKKIWAATKRGTWDQMKAYCQEQGGRLLENVSWRHFQDIKDTFDFGTYGWSWVGVYDSKWISSGEPVDKVMWSSHWHDPMDSSQRCGIMNIYDSEGVNYYGIDLYNCSHHRGAYCQFL